eukprot:Hpha_TRINITY_DN14281_c0_g1::TRINITY_DN14281_c0_g1_i1::g.22127::m.22127
MGCLCVREKGAGGDVACLMEPPDRPGVVTPGWLAAQLQILLRQDGAVTIDALNVDQLRASGADGRERTDGGGNSGSKIVRIRLSGLKGAESILGQSESVVLKWAKFKEVPDIPFPMRVAQVMLFGIRPADLFRVEHFFFQNCAAAVREAGLRLPEIYLSALRDGQEPGACCRLMCDCRADLTHTILMEDLTEYSAARPFSSVGEDRASLALTNVARLHRSTWGGNAQWESGLDRVVGGGGFSTSCIGLFGLRGAGVSSKKPDFATSKTPFAVHSDWGTKNIPKGDSGLEFVKKVAEKESFLQAFKWVQGQWATLHPRLGSLDPQCMVHGDCHHWNNLYSKSGKDVVLLDWQYFGAGRVAYEIVYFLATGVDVGDGEVDKRLLAAYHAELTREGRIDYSLQQLERDVRLAIVDAAVTMALSYGGRTFGIRYKPSVYKRAVQDEKQRDYAIGGMFIAARIWERLVHMYEREPGYFNSQDPAAESDRPDAHLLAS